MAQRKPLTLAHLRRITSPAPRSMRQPNLRKTLDALHAAARSGNPAAAFALARYQIRRRTKRSA